MRLLSTVTAQNAITTFSNGDIQVNGMTIGRGAGNVTLNSANGFQCLYNNTTGTYNTASGYQTLLLNTTGYYNTGYGFRSLYQTTTGYNNTAFGSLTLADNVTGFQNSAVGVMALFSNTSGIYNAAYGSNAGYSNTTGNGNTAIGSSALYTNATGNYNTAIGYAANVLADNLTNATAIGYGAAVTASNRVVIGNTAVTVIGGQVGWSTLSDGRFKTNIKEDVPGIDFIMQLRPVNYNFNPQKFEEHLRQRMPDSVKQLAARKAVDYTAAEKIIHTGFIAQEVEQVVNKNGYKFNAVHVPDTETDNYSINYDEFVVPLVKAVQQQQKQIQDLQKIISQQQQLLEEMKKQLDKLQQK